MTARSSNARAWALSALGAALLLGGLSVGWKRTHTKMEGEGVDFAVLHVMAVGIARGVNVYDLNAHPEHRENVGGVAYPRGAMGLVVYPPVTGFPMLPLALMPFRTAKLLWFAILNLTLILGIRSLVRVVAPQAHAYVWLLSAGIIMVSAAIRWGMMLLQGAPFVLGLLCFFVAAVARGQKPLSLAIAVFATAFKMTLALPFVGLLLLQRRIGAAFASAGAWLAFNGLGFARMGTGALASYQRSIAGFDSSTDPTNINSPDPWSGVSLPRLDWVYLFYGATGNLALSRFVSLACAAAVAAFLVREGWRMPREQSIERTALFLAPLVCLGSLCVYHHQYDVCLFFAPALLACLGPSSLHRPRWAVLLVVPLLLVMAALPIGAGENAALRAFGPPGIGLFKLIFPVVITLALAGSLVILRRSHESAGAVQASSTR
jgi:hypothetical protein